ncbi:hypothetical protein INR49_023879, partial [Caranx melampygus]
WVKDLGSETALHTIPAITGDNLSHLHQLIDVSGQQLKGPVYVAVALGRRLHVADAQICCQLLSLVSGHLAVLVKVLRLVRSKTSSPPTELRLPESFLTSRVPKLELYFHPGLDIKRAGIKIYTDRWIRHITVNTIREALQQRRLPHGRIPELNQYKFCPQSTTMDVCTQCSSCILLMEKRPDEPLGYR